MTNVIAPAENASIDETLARMRAQLSRLYPDFELQIKAELVCKINQLKREIGAIILGHNYMEPALYHFVPDYTGDSLELSRVSAKAEADIIVFCGVKFMAETAKILNPGRIVLIPSEKAGCSLAAGITAQDVRNLKERFPGVPVVTYVNTYADVKAESDYCCTSGNAEAVIVHLRKEGHNRILFLPDEYLATNTARELGLPIVIANQVKDEKDLPEKCIIGWNARCEVHEQFTVEDIKSVRKQFPEVVIISHPECSEDVVDHSDFSGSTKRMIEFVRQHDAPQFLLMTECSMGDNIIAENPNKNMLRMCSHRCPHMNQITLEDTLESLQKIQYRVELPQDLLERARKPIDRMISIF